MKVGTNLWANNIFFNGKGIQKKRGQIKRNMYAWITRHPQAVQSPISNDCLKVMFDYHTEPQLIPKLLLQVCVRELHNSLLSDPNDCGMKDARDEDDNIILSVILNFVHCCQLN